MFTSVNYASKYLVGDWGTAKLFSKAKQYWSSRWSRKLLRQNYCEFEQAGNISYPPLPDMLSMCVSEGKKYKFFWEFFYVLNGRSLVAFVANSVTQNTLEGVLCLVKLLFLAVWFLATENQSDCFRNWTLLLVFYDILFSRYESIMFWFLSGIFSWYRMSFLL